MPRKAHHKYQFRAILDRKKAHRIRWLHFGRGHTIAELARTFEVTRDTIQKVIDNKMFPEPVTDFSDRA